MARAHLIVYGRVQGVFFRASAQETAQSLGLVGFVRNLPDGAVEIVAEGDPESLGRLRSWAAHGPAGAIVDSVDDIAEKATGEFRRFAISG
ncbi:MAG TPA: acylphosphatase [Candidatus Acidoferrales bacterium]|nr:acylphosphatase [Candidatus Acidoferrales bacterium]